MVNLTPPTSLLSPNTQQELGYSGTEGGRIDDPPENPFDLSPTATADDPAAVSLPPSRL